MATTKKKGGPAGYEFDCESEPIAPGTKRGERLPLDGEPRMRSPWLWWCVGAIAIAALILGVLIGRWL